MVERWRPSPAIRASAALHGAALGLLALHPGWWPGLLALVAGNHGALAMAGAWPQGQVLGPTLSRLPGDRLAVALTFDDGPDPAVTPRVLDLLAGAGATATFFCIGRRALRHPLLVRRMVAEGHGVENHTHTHPSHFACLAGAALRREVGDAQAALADTAGRAPGWFRAPMGIRGPLLDPALARAGLRLASWTRRGYDTRCSRPDIVAARLLRGLAGGDVLLLHDGHSARSTAGVPVVLEALPAVLAAVAGAGLTATLLPAAMPAAAAGAGSLT